MLDNTEDVFQEPCVVIAVEHSSEDPGGGTIIAKQVIHHQLFWSKHLFLRFKKMRSDEHQQEVLQAVSV